MPTLSHATQNGSATGAFHRTAKTQPPPPAKTLPPTMPATFRKSGNVELTFLGHPFESFSRVLDPVLAVVAISRKQPDHLISAAGGRPCDIAGRKIDSLSNVVFVLQRHLHHAKTSIVPTCPAAAIDWKAPP